MQEGLTFRLTDSSKPNIKLIPVRVRLLIYDYLTVRERFLSLSKLSSNDRSKLHEIQVFTTYISPLIIHVPRDGDLLTSLNFSYLLKFTKIFEI